MIRKPIMERVSDELGIERDVKVEQKQFYSLKDFLVDMNRCYMNFIILLMSMFYGGKI